MNDIKIQNSICFRVYAIYRFTTQTTKDGYNATCTAYPKHTNLIIPITMTQASITDEWEEQQDEQESVTDGGELITPEASPPSPDHPAVESVDLDGMELTHPKEDWMGIPHPDNIITLLDEDISTEQAVLPDEVKEAIDSITEGDNTRYKFLVMTPSEVYEYLESLQWKSDLHLENFERKQVIVNQLSNGNRNGQTTKLSTYDKKRLISWEVQRRLHDRDFDEWGTGPFSEPLSKDNKGLPNDE